MPAATARQPVPSPREHAMRSTRAAALWTLILVALATLAAAPAAAQEGEADAHVSRSGFWLGGGLGGGVDDEGNGGGAGYLRLGGTLAPNLLLGGDVLAFTRDATATVREGDLIVEEDAEVAHSNVTASLLYYTSDRGDFYLKGGLGFAVREFTVERGDVTISSEDTGIGLTLGAGHDVQLGDGNLFLTPNLDVLLQGFDGTENVSTLFLLTLGLGFR